MATNRVLSKEVLDGFDKYKVLKNNTSLYDAALEDMNVVYENGRHKVIVKYNAVDTSPLSNYVMHPFWNNFVKIYPLWVAPNVLTFSGFMLLVVNFAIMIYYDLDFYASSRDHPEFPPVPSWVWLMCAINNFLSHTLDGTDGKQARRTGTSSPLGELFDHGLDSWASFFLPVAVYSVYGRGEYGVSVFRVYLVLLGVNLCFLASHWEKYNTRILYLPWGYDVSQLALTGVYLITFFGGYDLWKFSILGFPSSELFEAVMHVSVPVTIFVTLWNVYKGYRDKTGNMLSLTESVRPLFSTFLLYSLTVIWALYSSYDVLHKHTRIFYWISGTVFSNIACKLIIAQMSSTKCELLNNLLVPLVTIVTTVVFLDLGVLEFYLLCGYATFVTVSHVHFGICVVNEMCEHFNINAFTIKKPAKKE